MPSPHVRMASDYNRALIRPVRHAHVLIAVLTQAWRDTFARGPIGRAVSTPLLLGAVGFLLVWPFDAQISAGAFRLIGGLSGDFRRELVAWQQYGQGLCLIIVAIAIMLFDPPRTRRLLDLVLAVLVCQALSATMKLLIGRPRPRPDFEDPTTFLGPWGKYPVRATGESGPETWRLTEAWRTRALGGHANADLWSMPSSHTLFAAMLSVFLGALYPRLRPLLAGLTLLVACGRVMTDAHWASDVIVGAAIGVAATRPIVRRFAGVDTVDRLWRSLVDRNARPALPRVVALEHLRLRAHGSTPIDAPLVPNIPERAVPTDEPDKHSPRQPSATIHSWRQVDSASTAYTPGPPPATSGSTSSPVAAESRKSE